MSFTELCIIIIYIYYNNYIKYKTKGGNQTIGLGEPKSIN